MPIGPGKYDDLCTKAREEAGAEGAMLIIFGGKHGGGFSAQLPVTLTVDIPKILRDVARQIEESLEQGKIP